MNSEICPKCGGRDWKISLGFWTQPREKDYPNNPIKGSERKFIFGRQYCLNCDYSEIDYDL